MRKILTFFLALFAVASTVAQPYYHICVLGSNYSRKQQAIYDAEATNVKAELFLRPPFNRRITQIYFHFMNCRNSFRCDYSGGPGTETLTCNAGKIITAIDGTLNNDIVVLVSGKGFGSSDGARINVVGTGSHDNSTATNDFYGGNMFQREGALTTHEQGHMWLGPAHVEGTIMGSMTNGGAAGINMAFNKEQMETIKGILDSIAGPWTEPAPPTIQLTAPANGASINGNVQVFGTTGASTINIDILVDDVIVQSDTYWTRNIFANPTYGLRRAISLSAGPHTIKLQALDASGNTTDSDTVTITVL